MGILVESLIDSDAQLRAVYAEVRRRVAKGPADAGHDVGHLLRVATWALKLAGPDVDVREAAAAGLLHDIVNVPKDSPLRSRASEFCAKGAKEILDMVGWAPDGVARIAEAILDHSYSRGATPRSALGRALQDADRLEALGAIGIMRCISTGAAMGGRYFHPTDPWAQARPLDDRAFSVDHFFVKLLKLPDTMQTPAGEAEARRRAQVLVGFLEQLGEELGHSLPQRLLP
jgi:uncharacterized protein